VSGIQTEGDKAAAATASVPAALPFKGCEWLLSGTAYNLLMKTNEE